MLTVQRFELSWFLHSLCDNYSPLSTLLARVSDLAVSCIGCMCASVSVLDGHVLVIYWFSTVVSVLCTVIQFWLNGNVHWISCFQRCYLICWSQLKHFFLSPGCFRFTARQHSRWWVKGWTHWQWTRKTCRTTLVVPSFPMIACMTRLQLVSSPAWHGLPWVSCKWVGLCS